MSKTAVIIVTRNNPELLKHALSKYEKHPPGVRADFYIADAASDDGKTDSIVMNQKLGEPALVGNDRVECNFEIVRRLASHVENYDYFFFAHDDNVPIADNWLRPFVERMESGYCEPEAPEEYRHLPIGRVGGLSQFWRSYTDVQGIPVSCPFLQPAVEVATGSPAPPMFKYADCDRVLVSADCLRATNGLVTIATLADKREQLSKIFDTYLHYADEGMYPRGKYPPNQHWNKLTLLSEFMNSVYPLMQGFRTIGVDSDGYLEAIHGDDQPWANRYIAHYGGPNSLKALARHFGTDTTTVKAKMNDPILLLKAYKFFRDYYEDIDSRPVPVLASRVS